MNYDDVDLYEDLEHFEKENNQQDYQAENEILKTKCEHLEKQLSETVKRLKILEENHLVLSTNLSSLLKTARLEVSRKDRMISELRQTIDNTAFRRSNYKIPRREEQPQDTNSRTTSSLHQNNNRNDKFTSKHADDSTRHNDRNKNINKFEKIPEVVDNQIKRESDHIEEKIKLESNTKNFKYEQYEEEIYQPEKVCTTVFGERLQKKLQQQMLDEAAANKARKEKENDVKPVNVGLTIENQKNSSTTDIKLNNKENYYRLIPLDLKYEDKTRPDEFLDKKISYDVKSQNNNKRIREDSPNEYDKRRKVNDADHNQREAADHRRSRDGSSSGYDDRRIIKEEPDYFCSGHDTDLRPRTLARNEREQRHETNDNSTTSSRGNRRNTRSNDKFNRSSSQTRPRSYLKEPIRSKRIDQRSRSISTNRRQIIINNKNGRRNFQNSPRCNKRFEKNNNRYRGKNYERENPRARSRDDGKYNEHERDENPRARSRDDGKFNERENIKLYDKEEEKFDEKKKQQSPILDTNKPTDLRDRLVKRNQSNTNYNISLSPSSPELKNNLRDRSIKRTQPNTNHNTSSSPNSPVSKNNSQSKNEKTPEKSINEIKDPRIVKTSNIAINEIMTRIITNNNEEKDNKKNNNIEDILNTLEEGEIIESPIKKQPNNNDADNGSLNDSLREEKIENIEKFILNSMTVEGKLITSSPAKNNNEKNKDKNSINDVSSDNNKSTEKTCVTSEKKSNDKLTKSIDSVEKLIDKTAQDDNNKVKLKNSTTLDESISKIPSTSKNENDLSVENEKLLNLLDDASNHVIIKPITTNDFCDKTVDENQSIDKAQINDNDNDSSSSDKEKITEENFKQDENNKNTSSSDVSEELLVISPISSSPEKLADQDSHKKINTIVSDKIIIINKTEKITTTSIESIQKIEIKQVDDSKNNTTKSQIKSPTETIQKKDSKENDKDKKKVITVLRRRRGPVKLSDSSKCMTLVRSDTKKI